MKTKSKLDVGSMKSGTKAIEHATNGGKRSRIEPKKTPLGMKSDKKGEKRALADRSKDRLPSGKPDAGVKRAADTGGPVRAPKPVKGEKVGTGSVKRNETMDQFAKRREKETRKR